MRHYVRAHLHRRLFVGFGAAIFLTIGLLFGLWQALDRIAPSPWREETERLSRFVGGRFAAVWDAPERRHELARAIAEDLELALTLRQTDGEMIESFGACRHGVFSVTVVRGNEPLGQVEVCAHRHFGGGGWRAGLVLFVAGLVLWVSSGKLARRLTRPLVDLTRVAQDIGDGKLQSRARLRGREPGEVGLLAESINTMAEKIEKQMREQRELLAGVSHELRTPLTRMRVLIELSQTGSDLTKNAKYLGELDQEIAEIDTLVGELLASARLDFSALRPTPLVAATVAGRALERAGESTAKLVDDSAGGGFTGDPTLLARALANLIDNAKKHGGGLSLLRVKARAGRLCFEVEDGGKGFSEEGAKHLFQPFRSGGTDSEDRSSLGLGLALVRRIAEAHGGSAYAENRPQGGARVGFEVRA